MVCPAGVDVFVATAVTTSQEVSPKTKKKNLSSCELIIHKKPFFSHQEAPQPTSKSCTTTTICFRCTGAALRSVGILSVKGNLDALDLVTEFDGRTELQLHALLHGGQSQQQQGLAVDVLSRNRDTGDELKWKTPSGHFLKATPLVFLSNLRNTSGHEIKRGKC